MLVGLFDVGIEAMVILVVLLVNEVVIIVVGLLMYGVETVELLG